MDNRKYSCLRCGYIYDPTSDRDEGIPFNELPGDWLCPKCYADRTEYAPYKPIVMKKPTKNIAVKGRSKIEQLIHNHESSINCQ